MVISYWVQTISMNWCTLYFMMSLVIAVFIELKHRARTALMNVTVNKKFMYILANVCLSSSKSS